MIDHVSIPVRDLTESTAFYESVLSEIGFAKLMEKPGTVGFGQKYPEFWLNHRSDGHGISEGFHVCLRTRTTDQVRDFHTRALALGAQSDGAPGRAPAPRFGAPRANVDCSFHVALTPGPLHLAERNAGRCVAFAAH